MSPDWSFGNHNARVQEGARNAILVEETGAWQLRIRTVPFKKSKGPLPIKQHAQALISRNAQRLLRRVQLFSFISPNWVI
jgi:hypothetical protein